MFAHTEALKFTVRLSQLGVNYLNSKPDGHLFAHTSFKHPVKPKATKSRFIFQHLAEPLNESATQMGNYDEQCRKFNLLIGHALRSQNECWSKSPKQFQEILGPKTQNHFNEC